MARLITNVVTLTRDSLVVATGLKAATFYLMSLSVALRLQP